MAVGVLTTGRVRYKNTVNSHHRRLCTAQAQCTLRPAVAAAAAPVAAYAAAYAGTVPKPWPEWQLVC
jgi:hypothetical protein